VVTGVTGTESVVDLGACGVAALGNCSAVEELEVAPTVGGLGVCCAAAVTCGCAVVLGCAGVAATGCACSASTLGVCATCEGGCCDGCACGFSTTGGLSRPSANSLLRRFVAASSSWRLISSACLRDSSSRRARSAASMTGLCTTGGGSALGRAGAEAGVCPEALFCDSSSRCTKVRFLRTST
jgi:hypothetical protein